MSVTLYSLNRHHDVSGVSGEGDDIATICEFASGLTAMHWNSDTPTIEVLTDLRHVTELHAHGGASTLSLLESRLLSAYKRITPYVLTCQPQNMPLEVDAHPDHPDRLRVIVLTYPAWRWWVALLDGSTHAATHVEVNGEMEHTFITPDGNVWLQWYSPTATATDPLTTFDREDR